MRKTKRKYKQSSTVIKFIYKREYNYQMASQIRTIGFRNSLYVGEIDTSLHLLDRPQGIGLLLDDRFLMCLSNWAVDDTGSSSQPSGPTLVIYPTQQIFYCEDYPRSGKLSKNWCFISYQFAFFGNGDSKTIAVLHLTGNVISRAKSTNADGFECLEEINYRSQDNKWDQIQRIIGVPLQQNFRNLDLFIQVNFADKINRQGTEHFVKNRSRNQTFYGLLSNNQGLAFNLKYSRASPGVVSLGYCNQIMPTRNMCFGRQYKADPVTTYVEILEGNFDTQQLFNFKLLMDRPPASSHTARNFFRQTTIFCNKFISFREIDQLYQNFGNASDKYTKSINHKYGQKIIQGNQLNNRPVSIREKQPYSQVNYEPKLNKEYSLEQAKAKIEMQIARKKGSGHNFQTGIFRSSPTKYAAHKQSKYYRQQDANPITQRIAIQTLRKRSPDSTSRRYNYTEQNQIPQQVRIPQSLRVRPRLDSPTRATVPVHRQTKYPIEDNIHEFTLYPKAQTAECDPLASSPFYNLPSRDRIQKLVQLEQELKMRRQLDNIQTNRIQNQISQLNRQAFLQDQIWHRHLHEPPLIMQPINNQFIRRDPNMQLASLSSKPRAYRKYVNFDYTGQTKNIDRVRTPSTSPLAYRKPVKMAPSSPIVRLNMDSEVRNKQKENSGNPRKTAQNTTARRIYNYVE